MELPIDDNRDRLSYWLFYTQRCVAYAYGEVLRMHCEARGKPYVITPPQWGSLSLLLEQDGMAISTMSQKRGVDAPAGTAIVTRLEQFGLLERRHNREDRRIVKVYLTDEGRDIAVTMASTVERFEQDMRRGFTENEMDLFLLQLQQLIKNADAIEPGLGDRFSLLPKNTKEK